MQSELQHLKVWWQKSEQKRSYPTGHQ